VPGIGGEVGAEKREGFFRFTQVVEANEGFHPKELHLRIHRGVGPGTGEHGMGAVRELCPGEYTGYQDVPLEALEFLKLWWDQVQIILQGRPSILGIRLRGLWIGGRKEPKTAFPKGRVVGESSPALVTVLNRVPNVLQVVRCGIEAKEYL
jgi:hypothetical protein